MSESLSWISPKQEAAWVRMMALALPVLCIDAWTKALVAGSYELGAIEDKGLFTIVHAQNPGVNYVLHTLGVFPGEIPGLLFAAVGVYACYFAFKVAPLSRFSWIPMGLFLGGVLGNGLDVAAHGYGTDFIWIAALNATANFADVALTAAGVSFFLLPFLDRSVRSERAAQKRGRSSSA